MHLTRDLLLAVVLLLPACVERKPAAIAKKTQAPQLDRKPSPSTRVMQMIATRAGTPPAIDGKLVDAVWGSCAATDPLRAASSAAAQRTTARAAWDPAGLYLGFESEDSEIVSTITGCSGAPGGGDAVGVLIQVGEERLELVLGPCGTLCVRRGRSGGEQRWSTSKEIKAAVAIDGTLNGGDRDRSWTAELAIPWKVIRGGTPPPAAGELIRVNFYRIEAPGKSGAIAWSPRESGLLPDGELQLGDERGSSVEPTRPKPSTPAER